MKGTCCQPCRSEFKPQNQLAAEKELVLTGCLISIRAMHILTQCGYTQRHTDTFKNKQNFKENDDIAKYIEATITVAILT